MEAKILNFREAYELYLLLKPVFPSDFGVDVVVFIRQLLDNIEKTDKSILEELVFVFMGSDYDYTKYAGVDVVLMLFDGFTKNKIISLIEFFKVITDG